MPTHRASYTSGDSAAAREVEAIVSLDELVIAARDGTELARWPVRDVVPLDGELSEEQPLRLTHRGLEGGCLTFERHDVLDELARVEARFGARRRQGTTLVGVLTWAVPSLLLVGGLFLALPHLAAMATPLVPHSFGRDVGIQVRRALTASRPVCATPDQDHVLQRFAEELAEGLESPAASVDVYVVGGGPPNAFAAPGGQIVLFEELLDEAGSGREVAAVLAHEMGHAVERHPLRGVLRSSALSLFLGALVGDLAGPAGSAVGTMSQLTYSRGQERAADDWAVRRLEAHGYDSRGLREFFEDPPGPGGEVSERLEFLSTHPAPVSRVERLRSRDAAGEQPLTAEEVETLRALCEAEAPPDPGDAGDDSGSP